MTTWTKTTPPTWQKDAIASDRGWRHPVTGELLVSASGLLTAISDGIANISQSKPAEDAVQLLMEDITPIAPEPVTEPVVKPKRKYTRRKKAAPKAKANRTGTISPTPPSVKV